MPAKGSRAFTSLSPEDQWAIANGINSPNGGAWRNQWNTNDIDNEFSMMNPNQQAGLLQNMNQQRQRIYSAQQQYDNNQKSKAEVDAKAAADAAAKAAAKAAAAPANVSGGQASVPTVAQRMSRMGMAVAKGVGKGSIGMNQLNKYIPPGTTMPAVPAAPAAPAAPASSLVNQLAPKPVPMPQGNLLGKATY